MQPTEILMNEHRIIEQVLDCLEIMADRCEANADLDADSARKAIDFFRTFADCCHHAKEETYLFPMMEAKGFSRENGPTGVMRDEHDQGRQHVQSMADSVDKCESGDVPAIDAFVRHARSYCELLRAHIHKEDHCLFPMANQALNDEEQQSLLTMFEKVEHDDMSEGTHERYLQIADELASRFDVVRITIEANSEHGSCSPSHSAQR